MQAVVDKSAIQDVYTSVTVLRRTEDAIDQEKLVNNFLDSILGLRRAVEERAVAMENIDDKLMSITHILHDDLVQEDYQSIQKLVDECKAVYSSCMRLYAALRPHRDKGYIRTEAKRYKEAVDCFQETYQDIYSAFFVFPADEAFQANTKKLEELLG